MKPSFLFLIHMASILCLGAQPELFSGSFDAMKTSAISQGKPYAVYFHPTSQCSPCQTLEQHTLEANTVTDVLNQHYLFMKLNAESLHRQGFQLAAKYRVHLYPTILLFDQTGTLRETLTGMQTPSMLLPTLRKLTPAPKVLGPSPNSAPSGASSSSPPSTRAKSALHSGWWKVSITPLPSLGYGVQVGVYARYETILEEINRLQPHYQYPMAIRAELLGGQTVFKLIFGPFPNSTLARQFEQQFERSEGTRAVLVELGD